MKARMNGLRQRVVAASVVALILASAAMAVALTAANGSREHGRELSQQLIPASAAAVDATAPSDPTPPSALSCACELSAVQAHSGGSQLALLTCGVTAILCRRRRSPQFAAGQ